MIGVIICIELTILIMCLMLREYYMYGGTAKNIRTDYTNNNMYTSIVSCVLIFFAGFRGNFTSDYFNYSWFYNKMAERSFIDVITNRYNDHTEIMFRILNKVLHSLGVSEVILFLVLAIGIVAFVMKAFRESSISVWFSVLMFTTTGLYFISYNQVRVVLAASIVFWGMRYLYENNVKKYIFVVLVASLLHTTALIMLVFVLIDFVKFSKKMLVVYSCVTSGLCVFLVLYVQRILKIVTKYIYTEYNVEGAYGMQGGYPVTSLAVPVLIVIIVFLFRKNIDYNKRKDKIWVLSLLLYLILCVGCLRVEMLQWLVIYFQFYTFLLVPQLISRSSSKFKGVYKFSFITLLILYSLCSSVTDWKYCFFWE